MSVIRFYFVAAKLHHFLSVEKHVHRALHVAAFYDHRGSAHSHNFSRCVFHVRHIFNRHSANNFRFQHIGGKDAGAFQ